MFGYIPPLLVPKRYERVGVLYLQMEMDISE